LTKLIAKATAFSSLFTKTLEKKNNTKTIKSERKANNLTFLCSDRTQTMIARNTQDVVKRWLYDDNDRVYFEQIQSNYFIFKLIVSDSI